MENNTLFSGIKITDLQKTNFKQLTNNEAILKKVTSFLVFISLFLAIHLSGKIYSSDCDDNSRITLSGEVIISDTRDSLNLDETTKDSKNNAEQKAVVYISDGTTVYNAEAFSNAEIKTEKKKKKSFSQKTIVKKRTVVKNQIPHFKDGMPREYYHSSPSSGSLSLDQKEKIVFTASNSQLLLKALISEVHKTVGKLHFVIRQNFIYSDPYIITCHFSGKYMVRPPTFSLS